MVHTKEKGNRKGKFFRREISYFLIAVILLGSIVLFRDDELYAISLTGSTYAEKTFRYFSEHGYTQEAAAAIVGNIMGESYGRLNFDLHAVEDTTTNKGEGIGMCQWSFDRKVNFIAFCDSKGVAWNNSSLEIQVEFLERELNGEYGDQWHLSPSYSSALNSYNVGVQTFKRETDIEKATGYFCYSFERPNEQHANFSDRVYYARYVYSLYAKTSGNDNANNNAGEGWSAWSIEPIAESDSIEVQTTTLYRYYCFYCPVCGGREPFTGKSDCGQYTLSVSDAQEGWFPVAYGSCNPQRYSYTKSKYYTTALGDSKIWNFSAGNLGSAAVGTKDSDSDAIVIKTGYRYRQKATSSSGTSSVDGKKEQLVKITPTSKSFKCSTVKKKSQSFTIKVSNAKGKVSFTSENKKYVTVSSLIKGRVTVKKGTPKGSYRVNVSVKGNANYNPVKKTVVITVK